MICFLLASEISKLDTLKMAKVDATFGTGCVCSSGNSLESMSRIHIQGAAMS